MLQRNIFLVLVIATVALLVLLFYNSGRHDFTVNDPELPNPYGLNTPGENPTNLPLTPLSTLAQA